MAMCVRRPSFICCSYATYWHLYDRWDVADRVGQFWNFQNSRCPRWPQYELWRPRQNKVRLSRSTCRSQFERTRPHDGVRSWLISWMWEWGSMRTCLMFIRPPYTRRTATPSTKLNATEHIFWTCPRNNAILRGMRWSYARTCPSTVVHDHTRMWYKTQHDCTKTSKFVYDRVQRLGSGKGVMVITIPYFNTINIWYQLIFDLIRGKRL